MKKPLIFNWYFPQFPHEEFHVIKIARNEFLDEQIQSIIRICYSLFSIPLTKKAEEEEKKGETYNLVDYHWVKNDAKIVE